MAFRCLPCSLAFVPNSTAMYASASVSLRAPSAEGTKRATVVDRAVRAHALSALSPRGLSDLRHTVHPVGGEHGSKKLKVAHLRIDSK